MKHPATRPQWLLRPEAVLALATVIGLALVIYLNTLQSIVAIWNRSETYTHGYIILPVSLWLIWRNREALAGMQERPYWPGLLLLAGCGAAWLLAEFAGTQVVRQYAFVAMLPLVVLTVLGMQIARAMAFPLFFLLLAVPFGEAFIDPLVNFTADFTVSALQATGIPVLRNGNSFDIPSGSWSVVEACSGLRYLISSFTLGCLFSYLTYRSLSRRLAFIALSIVVPIIANGIRAYLIVLIGHFSGNKLAVGVDHLIYGWVFFGLVMLVMFWIGSMWREETDTDAPTGVPQARAKEQTSFRRGQAAAAAMAAIACMSVWPVYARLAENKSNSMPGTEASRFEPKWIRVAPFTDWQPSFLPADTEIRGFYQQGETTVGMAVLIYGSGMRSAKLISSANHMLPEDERRWQQLDSSVRNEKIGERNLSVRETVIESGVDKLQVWHGYWIDGRFTASDYTGKLLQARQKLLMRGNAGAAIFLYSPYGSSPEEGRTAMRRFMSDNLGLLEAALSGNEAGNR